jgi:3-hydroxyisobutyrate dehydrogenase-like beta-hydroxyacid dehydrogenase
MPKKSRKNVGLIGLGIIGSRVANALRLGGFHVYVWNRTPRAAPNFLASARQVAELCDVIQLFVADAQALFSVLDTMSGALTSSHVIICNATVGPEATMDAARLVQERGARYLDAPFSGSKAAAENRELVYYIGGDDKTLQAVEPALKASSKSIVKMGNIGDAATVKVATNMIAAVTVQTLAEAYAIVKDSGIDPLLLAEALKHHGVRSDVTDAKLAKILQRDYEPHFSLKNMFKDVQLGIHIANSLDIDLPASTTTAGVMYGGLTRGWADEDFSVLARSYQKEDQPANLPGPQAGAMPEKAVPADMTPSPLTSSPLVAGSPAVTSSPAVTGSPAVAGSPAAKADLAPDQPATLAKKESTTEEARDGGVKGPGLPAIPAPPAEKIGTSGLGTQSGTGQSADGSGATGAAVVEKREPPRERLAEQVSDLGGKTNAPAQPSPEKIAAPASEAAKPEAKTTEPKSGQKFEDSKAEEVVKLETADGKSGDAGGGKTANNTNGLPGEPAREHTPFVRIRRWFGTGSPN